MIHARTTSARAQRGFSLVELLAALAVGAIVTTAIIVALTRSMDFSQRLTGSVESRQQTRLALQLLERDVRMAGSGWGRNRVDGWSSAGQTVYWGLIPGPGPDDGSDSLLLIGAWSTVTTLRAAMTSSTSAIQCQSTNGFTVGDLCVVTNGAFAHLFGVTSVSHSPENLSHDTSSPYNTTNVLLNWPPGGYGIGAKVLRVNRVAYRMDSTSNRRPCLMRQEFGLTPQVAAWNVAKFTVDYLLQDGTLSRDPDTVTVIDRVIPTITTRTGTAMDSVQAEIRPRAF